MNKSRLLWLAHKKTQRFVSENGGNYHIALSYILKRLHYVNSL